MRAMRIHRHGGSEVLQLDEIAVPEPGPGEVLVQVLATSVNHRDIWMRRGHPHPAYYADLPAILGIDVCGDVAALGKGVSEASVGDRITANPYIPCGHCVNCRRERSLYCLRFDVFHGSYAEYALVRSSTVVPLEPHVPAEHGACFHTYLTAWQMLVRKAGMTPDDTVFVWAGTSGLGSAAVAVAQLVGARVIASAGTEAKRAVLEQLKPDLILDHHAPDLVERAVEYTEGVGPSIVFEHVGKATWQRSLEMCAPGGAIVSAGATSGDDASMDVTYAFVKQVRILGSRLGDMDDAFACAKHMNRGRFTPLIGERYALEDMPEAHRALESGEVAGKIIVSLADKM
jgi:NADPH:quinone reductase-like Zn-dependent oxidoreductase